MWRQRGVQGERGRHPGGWEDKGGEMRVRRGVLLTCCAVKRSLLSCTARWLVDAWIWRCEAACSLSELASFRKCVMSTLNSLKKPCSSLSASFLPTR